jgi:16S rRNA G966 N2-methylase RsmD
MAKSQTYADGQLVLCDCLEHVPALVRSLGFFGLIYVDPPFNTGLNSSRLRLQRRAGEADREERAERTEVREHAPQRPTKHPRMLQRQAGPV